MQVVKRRRTLSFRSAMTEERQEEAEGYFHRAFELHLNEKYAEAIQHYRRSIELHPTPEAHTYLGWSYSKISEYDRAIQECLKAIRLDSDFGNPYNDIGAYLIQQGKIDEAIPWLEKALNARRYEGRCYPHMNLARIWEQKLHFGRAIEEYRYALMENPDYTPALVCLTKLQSMLN